MASLIGQILLAAPFVVFAYWYEQEETLFQTAPTFHHTIYRHAVFGLLFSMSFAILGIASRSAVIRWIIPVERVVKSPGGVSTLGGGFPSAGALGLHAVGS
jgi:hypothetical protein